MRFHFILSTIAAQSTKYLHSNCNPITDINACDKNYFLKCDTKTKTWEINHVCQYDCLNQYKDSCLNFAPSIGGMCNPKTITNACSGIWVLKNKCEGDCVNNPLYTESCKQPSKKSKTDRPVELVTSCLIDIFGICIPKFDVKIKENTQTKTNESPLPTNFPVKTIPGEGKGDGQVSNQPTSSSDKPSPTSQNNIPSTDKPASTDQKETPKNPNHGKHHSNVGINLPCHKQNTVACKGVEFLFCDGNKWVLQNKCPQECSKVIGFAKYCNETPQFQGFHHKHV
ncbi:hypothetical protein HDV02_001977 [Globomyces sp. JEL0801]|nr:hypothetical protein HDV02_001977 [Globomyces sp. JEL0801]